MLNRRTNNHHTWVAASWLLPCFLSGCMLDGWPEAIRYKATCESRTVVHRTDLGVVVSERSCESDEICLEVSEYEAVCRLSTKCHAPPAPGKCESTTELVICSPADGYLARIDCSPGRCEANTTAGARCVDQDAVPCDKTTCADADVLDCLNGFTHRRAACPASPAYASGVCRENSEGALVCAQPEAAPCDGTYAEQCDGNDALRCSAGFVWRHQCPDGMHCISKVYGEVALPVCAE